MRIARRFATFTGLTLGVLLVLVTAVPAQPDRWTDIPDALWVSDYGVTAQQVDGVADGHADGTFRPYDAVTRGQLAKMAVDGFGVPRATPAVPTFVDVPTTHIFFSHVEGGAAAGLIGGYADGSYRPGQFISRQQTNSILARYLAGVELVVRGSIGGSAGEYPSLAAWYAAEGAGLLAVFGDQAQVLAEHRPATAYLVSRGIVKGANGLLLPTNQLSRAQAAVLIIRTAAAAAGLSAPIPAPTGLATIPAGPSNDATPLVVGWATPGGAVTVFDTFAGQTVEFGVDTADADGDFSVAGPALAEGEHLFTATVESPGGGVSAPSTGVVYLLDLTPPTGSIEKPRTGTISSSVRPSFSVRAEDVGSGVASVTFLYRKAGSSAPFIVVSTDSVAGSDGLYYAVWGTLTLPNGDYEFGAVVRDRAGNETTLSPVDATVLHVGPNSPPLAADDAFSTDEDSIVTGNVLAPNPAMPDSDPDGDSLVVSRVAGSATNVGSQFALPSGALVTLGAGGGLTYDPNGAFESLGGGDTASDSFTYTISDPDGETDSAAVTVTINGIDDPPTITSSATPSAAENQTAVIDVQSTDPEGDTEGAGLTYSLTGGADQLKFSIVASTGVLTFQAAPDFENPTDADTNNVYLVQVTVTDSGSLTDVQDLQVTVTNVNEAPAATADTYYTFGNTELAAGGATAAGAISVTDADNVLDNDTDPDTTAAFNTLSVTAASGATTKGGSYAIATDGSFTYSPPLGTGTTLADPDTFAYTLTDGTNSVSGTVKLVVEDLVWYIDNTAGGAGGTGASDDPFLTLADFNAVQGGGAGAPAAGDMIFVDAGAGAYTGGITLLNDQRLRGEGEGLTLPLNSVATTLVTAGTDPVLDNITLASGNTVKGLDLNSTSGTALLGASVGALIVSNVDTIAASGGKAVDLSGGTAAMNVDIGAVTVTGSAVGGVRLNGHNAAAVTSFAGVNITTTGGSAPGFLASSAGIVTVGGIANTITTVGGSAVNIANTVIGPAGVTFRSITVNQIASPADTPGIVLASTGTGTFTVTGTGTTAGSGGTIQNITDADGVTLNNTGGRVTLANMIIQGIAGSLDAGAPLNTRSGADGIHGQQVNGGLTLRGVTMRRFSDSAVNGALFSDGVSATSWNGLEIRDCTLEDSNRFASGPAVGDSSDEGLVRIVGLTGTVVVDNSTLQRGAELMDVFTTPTGTLDMTVQSSTFNRSIKEFTGIGTNNVGKNGIDVTVEGTADAVVRVGDPAEANAALGNTFTDNATASLRIGHDAGATGAIDVVISKNTFEVNDHTTSGQLPGNFIFDFPQGGVVLNPGGGAAGTFEAIVSGNLFDQVMHADGGLGQLTVTMDDLGSSNIIVRNNTFQLPWDGPVQLRADGNGSGAVLFENNVYVDGSVGSAGDDLGSAFPSPFVPYRANVRNAGALDLTVRNETLPLHDLTSGFANSFDASVSASGGTLHLALTNILSPYGYRLAQNGGAFNLYQGVSASSAAATILRDNGNRGGGGVDGTDPPTVVTVGTITASGVAPTLPVVAIP